MHSKGPVLTHRAFYSAESILTGTQLSPLQHDLSVGNTDKKERAEALS